MFDRYVNGTAEWSSACNTDTKEDEMRDEERIREENSSVKNMHEENSDVQLIYAQQVSKSGIERESSK